MLPTTDIDDLAKTLADGFDSLLVEVQRLSRRQQDLEQRLNEASEYARSAVHSTANDPDSDSKPYINGDAVRAIHNLRPVTVSPPPHNPPLRLRESIDRGAEASEALKEHFQRKEAPKTMHECPFSGKVATEDLEQDYTTLGPGGNLGCPFSRMNGATSSAARSKRDLPTPPSAHAEVNGDSVKAEQRPDKLSSPPLSVTASANKCPIRFLDQQSPEEVAAYFETHKHEIPRSHEVCVKRYQKNSESIRQLDAKYGNLVSMIQGLGAKHQAYLPAKEGDEDLERGPSPAEHIEKWAEDVSTKPDSATEEGLPDAEEAEERSGHFERSLREVRVGESPSRPWGISVPVAHQASRSANLSSEGEHINLVPDMDASHGGECAQAEAEPEHEQHSVHSTPIKSGSGRYVHTGNSHTSANTKSPPRLAGNEGPVVMPEYRNSQSRPQMIFTGPVFFGYSPEQASRLMQQGGFGGGKPAGL